MPRVDRHRSTPLLEALEPRLVLSDGMGSDLLIAFARTAPRQAVDRVLDRLDATVVESFEGGPLLVRAGAEVDLKRLLPTLRRLPSVRYVELDQRLRDSAVYPTDAEFPRQWGLNSSSGIDIDAPEAWQITTGSSSTVVAVIDSGLDLTHPDLVGRVWVNPGEIPGNGIDDERNGFIDDIHGWNFLARDSDVSDGAGHGTHVSGIIAATGNGGGGAVGVNWQARIMPLKFIDAAGDGSISDAVRAIYYAAQNGARVINASWGGPTYSKSLADAVRFAGARGAVFVTAAGNESRNNDRHPSFPASLKAPHVLAVAAVDTEGRLAGFSNFGKQSIDIAAPGVNIRSTVPGGYGVLSGTSMSAPFVSGVASLVTGMFPHLSAAQIARRVVTTARHLPGLANRTVAKGIVNALRALDPSAVVERPETTARTNENANSAKRLSSHEQVQAQLFASDEYYALHGGSPSAFVNGLYRDTLNRAPTASETRSALARLSAGGSRATLAAALLAGEEGRRMQVARWHHQALAGSVSLAALMKRQDVVGQAARLASRETPESVRSSILGSKAYLARHGGSTLGILNAMYSEILGHEVSPSEAEHWLGRLAEGLSRRELALNLFAYDEAKLTQVALWYQSILRRSAQLAQLKADPTVAIWAQHLTA
jgi:hypothetical protein